MNTYAKYLCVIMMMCLLIQLEINIIIKNVKKLENMSAQQNKLTQSFIDGLFNN